NKKNEKNLETLEEALSTEQQELKVKEESRDLIGEQIGKNRENYDIYLEILGQQLNINLEKGKENEALDKAIGKRNEEIKQLEDKLKKEGDSNGKTQEKIDKLKGENSQLQDIKYKLSDVNGSLDRHNSKYETGESRLTRVYGKAVDLGHETNSNVKLAGLYNTEMGKDLKKDIKINQSKDPDEENKKWSSPITKVISFFTKGKKPDSYAVGTNYHTGGPAFVGEEGPELVKMGGKTRLLDFGLYDLPVGAKVYTHEDTVSMLRGGL